MDPAASSYAITFPAFMAGAVVVFGSILGMLVRKWINDSEKVQDAKDKDVHDAFQTLHARIDKLRDQHDEDQRQMHRLELDLVQTIKREELNAMREEIKQDVHSGTAQVIAVIQAMKGQQ